MQKAHIVLHCGRDRMREKIHHMGFAWNGINEVFGILLRGVIAVRKWNYFQKPKEKKMISSCPLERFQIDCLGIYEEIGKKTNLKN